MKRLISLLTLLLLWPAFASATTPGISEVFLPPVTSGTASNLYGAPAVPFDFAGNGYSGEGSVLFLASVDNPLSMPVSVGPFDGGLKFNTVDGETLSIGLTVNGVGYGIPSGGSGGAAGLEIDGGALITGVGTFSGPASLFGIYTGLPAASIPPCPPTCDLNCNVANCVNFHFGGSGIVTMHVIPDPYNTFPGALRVASETFTFGAPEPATLSLFALGLVGVGFMRRRKKS
jgi:hypothetical protein